MTDRKISTISIVIPTLGEQEALERQLVHLQRFPGLEVVIADGSGTDSTPETAARHGARFISGSGSRGARLNHGAALASGEVLFFLHCDTFLPGDFTAHASALLSLPDTAAGAFRLSIDAPGASYRVIEWGANMRSRLLQLPYGDQAIFTTRGAFLRAGGFPDQPIMEDLALVNRLKTLGHVRLAPAAVTTSPRRWQRLGTLRTTVRNQLMLIGYLLGVNRQTLYRFYYRQG